MRVKHILLLIILVFGLGFSASSAQFSTDAPLSYTGFYLDTEEGVGYSIDHLLINGSSYFEINVEDRDGNEYPTNMTEGGSLAFGLDDIPDWTTDAQELLNVSGVHNGNFNFSYAAPWTIDPDYIPQDGPPAMFWPMIPFGDAAYWTALDDSFSASGYTVTNNDTYFQVSYSNASSYTGIVAYEKTTGLLAEYVYDGVMADEQGSTYEFDMTLRLAYMLAPSQASQLDWYSTDLQMDYNVLIAEYNNGTDGLELHEENPPPSGESGPLYGEGYLYTGDTVQIEPREFRDFETDGPAGYEFEIRGPSGYVKFNASLELPEADPGINNRFLYPLFPATDFELVQGYFGIAEAVSENYTTSFTDQTVTLNFTATDLGTIEATWNITTGIMLDYEMQEFNSDGVHVKLDLVAAQDLSELSFVWGPAVGDGLTLEVLDVNFGGNSTIDLDGTGYIGAGDFVYFEVIEIDSTTDDGPPRLYYDLVATHGSEANISFGYPYPGTYEMGGSDDGPGDGPDDGGGDGGPPLFLVHHLLGDDALFNWVDTLYTNAGADYNVNSTHITIDWNFSIGSGTAQLNSVWRKSDGALQYYSVETSGLPTEDSMHLEFAFVGDGNHVDDDHDINTNTTGSESDLGFDLPAYDLYVGGALIIAAIPVLRRKSKVIKL